MDKLEIETQATEERLGHRVGAFVNTHMGILVVFARSSQVDIRIKSCVFGKCEQVLSLNVDLCRSQFQAFQP
ncbi:hypothetical protein D3C86_2047480 [compost metagenome]